MISVCQPVMNLKMLVLVIFLSILAYAVIFLNECEDLPKKALKYYANHVQYEEMNRTKRKHSTRLKHILLWTQKLNFPPFPKMKEGQTSFIENQCPQVDCYFTKDRNLFGGSLENFDALVFNVINLNEIDLPSKRYVHQKYIFASVESPINFPVCKSLYDNYFNLTYTYKLNSDILLLYLEIRYDDKIVGPKTHMKWIKSDIDNKTLDAIKIKWKQKSRTVAWMASNCLAKNRRNKVVHQIHKSLNNANLTLDTYGKCGTLSCPKKMTAECWNTFERTYYFYMSFENANSEDYVSEKLLYPLQHYVIPIVYGGAKYSRFLPPGSYLDASILSPDELVANMKKIISSFDEYSEYFKWRSKYSYTDADTSNICALCSALHNNTIMENRKSYEHLREWWLPKYRSDCRKKIWKLKMTQMDNDNLQPIIFNED